MESNRAVFLQGMRHGIPIALGYFAVSFSLGITARDCGFNAFQGFLASYTTYASAGQYIGFTLYAANATLFQLAVMTLITNLRYLLMGFALNQRLPENPPPMKRLITIARPGSVNPFYMLGAWTVAAPMWSVGTALGIVMGNLLPMRLVSALSVALYGMFMSVIIPPARRDKIVCAFVAVSFASSYAASQLPMVKELSAGNRTIILTVVISAVAAIAFPVKKKQTAAVNKEDPGNAA